LVAAFYFVTNRYFGWWQPSESLTDPNILGNALPALAPIGMALQAGFMEECLFRAVPLSIAALIGERFGVRRLAIGVALVIEALVIFAGLVPLAVVLGQRALVGRWLVFPSLLRNRAWEAAAAIATVTAARVRAEAGAWSQRVQRVLPLIAVAGLLAIALAGDFRSAAPALNVNRAEAE